MINKSILHKLRKTYPPGTRIVLDHMLDPAAPAPGTQGTVVAVDDLGDVLVDWDDGSSLAVILPESAYADTHTPDAIHIISTDAEIITTLDHFGRHQQEVNAICPRCGQLMEGKTTRHALSRYAEIYVCDRCGGIEALEKAGLVKRLELKDWAVVKGCCGE